MVSRNRRHQRTVLGIWAHPDDEAYLSAGLMAETTDRGGQVVCVTATRGELGSPDPVMWPPARLAAHRERELRNSLAVLGVHDVRFLDHRDGACEEADEEAQVHRLAEILREVRPDLVVTFGPDGITGHPDHVAVSRWASAAWLESPSGQLLYATVTDTFLARHDALLRHIGFFMGPAPGGARQEDLALRVALEGPALDRKRLALRHHASQSEALAALIGEEEYRRWWREETFRCPTVTELAAVVGSPRKVAA